jgi:type IV pilus assembly protein PilY1
MNRRTLVAVMLVAGSLSAALFGSRDAVAVVSNADYTAVPAFVSNTRRCPISLWSLWITPAV